VLQDSVKVVADIDAAVEVVWRYLTAGRGAWWPEMRFEAAVGSPLVETWVEGDRQMSATGSVTRCDAPHVLGFSWSEQSWDHPLEVVIELEAHGQGPSSRSPSQDSPALGLRTRCLWNTTRGGDITWRD
jgi:uncharacterized protein YndB with AHSA1/START domain